MNATEQLYILGRELWRCVLIGNAPPAIAELRERMRHPQRGDLVIEVSSFSGFDPDGVGRLLRIEGDRWVIEPWDRPGEEQGWRNATFVALPDRNKWMESATKRWLATHGDRP